MRHVVVLLVGALLLHLRVDIIQGLSCTVQVLGPDRLTLERVPTVIAATLPASTLGQFEHDLFPLGLA